MVKDKKTEKKVENNKVEKKDEKNVQQEPKLVKYDLNNFNIVHYDEALQYPRIYYIKDKKKIVIQAENKKIAKDFMKSDVEITGPNTEEFSIGFYAHNKVVTEQMFMMKFEEECIEGYAREWSDVEGKKDFVPESFLSEEQKN